MGVEVAHQWVCRETWARVPLLSYDIFGNVKEADEEGDEKTDTPLRGLQKKRTKPEGELEGADGPGSPGQLYCSPKASGWF